MENKAFIELIHSKGLEILRKSYNVTEREIEPELRSINIGGRIFNVRQFEIEGVGNLTTMECTNLDNWNLTTFIISPYFKNIPLFTSDFILSGENREFLNEIYNLVPEQNELYADIVSRYKSNMESCKLENLPTKSCWYDDIRPAFVHKKGTADDDNAILSLFEENIKTFVETENSSPALVSAEEKASKWKCVFEYARKLVEDGGVSTDVFKQVIGEEKTKKFFYDVFFATNKYLD